MGNSPQMATVQFDTDQLILDADSFELGVQKSVEQTVVKRSKDQGFTLTKDYDTDGTLEFWQRDLKTREETRALMLERFGDEKGDMPAFESTIDLQALVKAHGGLKFFTPHAKVRLGDATKEELLSFTADQGWLEAYTTVFDLEKGTGAAENAHVLAPGGILTGRLDKDENEDLFSEKLYTQNGSTLLVRGTTTLRGPLHHRGDFLTSFLVLNSPKDHLFEAATGRVLKDCELNGGGDLHLKLHLSVGHYLSASVTFNNSIPSSLHIDNEFDGHDSILYNHGSIFHAFSKTLGSQFKDIDVDIALSPLLIGYTHLVRNVLLNYVKRVRHDGNVDRYCASYPSCNGGNNAYARMGVACITIYKRDNERPYPAQTSFGDDTASCPMRIV